MAGIVNVPSGSDSLVYRFELVTSNKQWVCPSNIASKVCVRLFGGGGSGAYGYASAYSGYDEYGGGGGGGGHMAYGEFNIAGGTSVSITIGNQNGATSFGAYLSANGGASGSSQDGGNGGSGGGGGGISTGDVRISKGGTASYGGKGADGCYNNEIVLVNGSNGINTSSINNSYLIKGTAAGGSSSKNSGNIAGGGGGGYGSNGGNAGTVFSYGAGGGGGGGYGGKGGNGASRYNEQGGAGTGYGTGGGGGACDNEDASSGGAGAKGCALISYLVKQKNEPLYPI